MPVRSERVAVSPFRGSVTVFGRLEPAERFAIRARAAGRVHYSARFRAGLRTGERVRRDEWLFTLDNGELALSLREAELVLEASEAELERVRRGVEGGVRAASERDRQQVETTLARERFRRAQARTVELAHTAPSDGVLEVHEPVAPGSEIEAGALLAFLSGDGDPKVEARATASDLPLLRPGLDVHAVRSGTNHVVARGSVGEVSRSIERNGTARVVIALDETLALPPPGEGLELRILLARREAVLTVPERALVMQGGVATVFVIEPSGVFGVARARTVNLGAQHEGRIEVLDGLIPGERIVSSGVELLSEGMEVVDVQDAAGEGDPDDAFDDVDGTGNGLVTRQPVSAQGTP